VGTVVLLALSLPVMHATAMPDATTILVLAGMGLASSMLGFLLWNYAGARLPAERLGLVLYLIPIVCVLAGVGFLSEPLTSQIIFGGALTVSGVWLASRLAKDAPNAVDEANESAG